MKRKKILVFCYRFYDFRLWLMTGLLESLAEKFDLSLLCSDNLTEALRGHLPQNIEIISYKDSDIQHGSIVLEKIHNFCAHIFSMTYANQHKHKNRPLSFHRAAFLKKGKEESFWHRIARLNTVLLSYLASSFSFVRYLISGIYKITKPSNPYKEILKKNNPDLVILTTYGQGLDGIFMIEAQKLDIKILVTIQSWDKTSSKGYPFLFPDYMIVWNESSRKEALNFLGFPSESVWAEGSPVWDNFFSRNQILSREQFLQRNGLQAGYKTIFVAINSWSYHKGNKDLIALLATALKEGKFRFPVQILMRPHPSYTVRKDLSDDLEKFIDRFRSTSHLHFEVQEKSGGLHTQEDSMLQASSFAHCDLTISSVSTFMIESAIFDIPAINVEYGRWINEVYDFDISEYKAEHILRIYDYNATYRAFNPHQLIEMINQALEKPTERAVQRERLIELEAGLNRGQSKEAYLGRIAAILGDKF